MKKQLIFLFTLLLYSSFLAAQTIDTEKSKINFSVSNMGIRTVDGTISGMKGMIQFDENDLSNSKFQVSYAVNTINTNNKARDKHLRNPDFFEVETYPTIQFSSSSITKDGDAYTVKGNLTIKDVTKEVTFPFTVSENNGETTLTGKLTIDRKEYHVGMDTGKFMVGYDIEVEVVCVLR
ncbi:MAG: YceI family protein [Flammeovirgaceae bacterium]